MCTVIILNRPEHDWPILIAANRDERHDRPWKPPAAHWADRPDVIAGLDERAGGSWLGINGTGVVAAVLNRQGTLGPADGKRSRGELVLDALDHPDATDAAAALRAIDPRAYQPFNLIVADNRDAFLVILRDGATDRSVEVAPLPEGLSMVTAIERDDPDSPRIRLHRPRFAAARPPDPDLNAWSEWEALLGSRDQECDSGPSGALFIDGAPPDDSGRFGTVSSSIIALPSIARTDRIPIWRSASGAPETWRWEDVAIRPRN
jgi:hypothetical protein